MIMNMSIMDVKYCRMNVKKVDKGSRTTVLLLFQHFSKSNFYKQIKDVCTNYHEK